MTLRTKKLIIAAASLAIIMFGGPTTVLADGCTKTGAYSCSTGSDCIEFCEELCEDETGCELNDSFNPICLQTTCECRCRGSACCTLN